jgi:hypothetical protein
MPYLLVGHKVADFSKRKPAYDAFRSPSESGSQRGASAAQFREPERGSPFVEAEDIQKAK